MLDRSLVHGAQIVVIVVAGAVVALGATPAPRPGAALVAAIGAGRPGLGGATGRADRAGRAGRVRHRAPLDRLGVDGGRARSRRSAPRSSSATPTRSRSHRCPPGRRSPSAVGPRRRDPPPGTPATGRVAEVDIPGTASGFDARPGWVYLPPAYLGGVPAQLPVLVLLAGQPGGPSDWLDGGRLAGRMDRYAAAHHELAPVVLMPDDLGSEFADPQCVDPPDPATTYLSVDVPAWIDRNLQVGSARAVAGLSYGGTCALRLALTVPSVWAPAWKRSFRGSAPGWGSRVMLR